tara:strand:- start:224 stop:1465 length:1242 start_codon:yes stop_codon:yes gene_type:complete
MSFFYSVILFLFEKLIFLLKPFNKRIENFIDERKNTFQYLNSNINSDQNNIWIHVASLGEYEQGLPIFLKLKELYKDHKIILSFFSSSGYEIRKNNPISDFTVYLPLDTKKNAKNFIKIINPKLVFFVKYEFWPNYLNCLKVNKIPTFLLVGVFRKNQWFFKYYGIWMKKNLLVFNHFFVQDEISKNILNINGFSNTTIMGDSRYERVIDLPSQNNKIKKIENFINSRICIVGGSTWKTDEDLFINFINKNQSKEICYIIVPHKINYPLINKNRNLIQEKTVLMSDLNYEMDKNIRILYVDSVGILTKIYSYADVAYVGGGMGKTGLHNTLEPAAFSLPIIIGKKFEKFREVKQLVKLGGVISINDQKTFNVKLSELIIKDEKRKHFGEINYNFIKNNVGASSKVINHLKKIK